VIGASQRIGYGEDAHRLVKGKPLVIGGVIIPGSPHGPQAHSDGDALLHALADAFLSAFALGDIGEHFPPSDPRLADLDSQVILRSTLTLIEKRVGEVEVDNFSAVLTLDEPKLGRHRQAIQQRLAILLGLEPSRIGLTFKTSEGLAPHHIQTRVAVLLRASGGAHLT